MRSKRKYLSVFLAAALAPLLFTAPESMGQGKEKPTAGTADTWRQSLPSEAETQNNSDEINATLPLASTDENQKTLLSLERGWLEAVKVGDVDSLSQLISGDFTFVSPRALSVMDRNQYLTHALRDLKLSLLELDKITVRLFGRTAIVAGVLTQKGTARGEEVSGTYLFTDVWINRGGTWRVVSRHESQVTKQE